MRRSGHLRQAEAYASRAAHAADPAAKERLLLLVFRHLLRAERQYDAIQLYRDARDIGLAAPQARRNLG